MNRPALSTIRTRPTAVESGITLLELTIAAVIIVVTAASLVSHLAVTYRGTHSERDRVFAYNKAQSILAEIHALAADSLENPMDIDSLDDSVSTRDTLSVQVDEDGGLVLPGHPASGNSLNNGQWLWSRQVAVQPVEGTDNRSLRYVTVRVFKRDIEGTMSELAAVSSIVNGLATSYPTTQVYDLYLIAIENIPGWWVHMESIRPFMESVVSELESNNPGLELRTHWITKAGYGRDATYRPFVNDTQDSQQQVDWVYYYPGRMPDGNQSTYYYVPSVMRGRFFNEEGEQNGYDSDTNPYPYAFADAFNHTMRYPAARAFHDARVAEVAARADAIVAADIAGTAPPSELVDMSEEPTLRLFLEGLNSESERYRHAVVLNLHGELLPIPALRNYSDAAKDPEGMPGVRVVAHPEELRTQRPPSAGDTDVRLRVYAYVDDPESWTGDDRMPEERPIAIQVMDVDLTDGTGGLRSGVTIENLAGGVPVGGSSSYRPMTDAKPAGDGALESGEMFYDVSFEDPGFGQRKYTLIRLYNTPVRCGPAGSGGNVRGLYANRRSRLYGLEYVPSCTGSTSDFSRDLYATGDGPKNTARWVITVPGTLFGDRGWADLSSPPNFYDPRTTSEPDPVLTFRTRIWDPDLPDPLLTGTWPRGDESRVIQPANLSETYTWWAATRDAVPFTERFQYQGDPRHNPYKDLLDGDPDFPNGYNWYFDDLRSGSEHSDSDYAGLDRGRLTDLWMGRQRQDVARGFQIYREGLIESDTIFTTLNGFSFYYVGNGGEIGSDSANGYPNSIPSDLTPFGDEGNTGYVNTITGSRRFVRSTGWSGYWWGKPWLGELYPDEVYVSQWSRADAFGDPTGNLRAGEGSSEFYQAAANQTYAGSDFRAWGTSLHNSNQNTGGQGCTSFFNTGTSSRTFQHFFADGSSAIATSAGDELSSNYGVEIPASAAVNRPFSVDRGTTLPPEWSYSPYTEERTSASIGRVYFDSTSTYGDASAMVDLVDADREHQGSFVVNGFAASNVEGVSFVARYSLISALHSFFENGDESRTFRIKPTPRIEITSPNEVNQLDNPGSIELEWDIAWERWDGEPYAGSAEDVEESESEIVYALLYSRDNGRSWICIEDGNTVELGTGAENGTLSVDLDRGPESYTWSVPATTYPAGSYLVRIECYRQGQRLHYSHHQRRLYIKR